MFVTPYMLLATPYAVTIDAHHASAATALPLLAIVATSHYFADVYYYY